MKLLELAKAMLSKQIVMGIITLMCVQSCTNEEAVIQNGNDVTEKSAIEETFDLQSQVKTISEFKVVNGCLKFRTMEDYVSTYHLLSKKSQKELLAWSEGNGYTSLLETYVTGDSIFMSTFVATRDYEPGEHPIDKSDRVLSLALSTLYNEEGILVVSDTIFKVRGQNVYMIENEDFEKAKRVQNVSDINSLDDIPHFRHTISKNDLNQPITTRAGNDNHNRDRSFVINVSSSRREFVEFHRDVVTVNPAVHVLETYMKGQAQKKSLGIWWPNFDDEIYYGQVHITAGLTPLPPFGYGNNTVKIYGCPYSLQQSYNSVTWQFTKNSAHPSEIYTNDYYY